MAHPDAELVIRNWLLTESTVTALVGTHVATTMPTAMTFPFVIVQLIRQDPDAGEAPVIQAWVQVDCYSKKKDYATASRLARIIWDAAEAFTNRTVTVTGDTSAHVYGITLNNLRRLPEPETEWARYMLDLSVTMRSV